jgi:DNA modification methylase
VALWKDPMENHTKAGEICLEPFSGSGSQLLCAEQLGRRAFCCELEPRYVDVAIGRWSRLTERQPTLESTGQTFEQVGRERCVT